MFPFPNGMMIGAAAGTGGGLTPPSMMSVGTVASAATSTPITPGLPSGTTTNDILILLCETDNISTVTTPTGYTAITGSPVTSSGTDPSQLNAYWRRAGASETAPTVSFSGDHIIGQIIRVAGCKTSGSPFEKIVTAVGAQSSSHTIPGFTTTVNNQLVIDLISTGWDFLGGNFTSWANASLTSYAEILDNGTATGNGGGIAAAAGVMATAGAVSASTVNSSWLRETPCMKVSLLPA